MAVAEHPEILVSTNNEGIVALVSQLADDLEELELFESGLLPEIAQQVLLRSGENLELIWPELQDKPHKNLLLVAAKKTLKVLGTAEDGEPWPRFQRHQLIDVTEAVFEEVLANPGWLIASSGKLSPSLGLALSATIDVLRANRDSRITPALAAKIVRSALRAASLRKEFIGKLPASSQRAGELVLSAAIDTIVGTIFDEDLNTKASWQLVREEIVAALIEEVLEVLGKHKLNAAAIVKLETALTAQIEKLVKGQGFDLNAFVQKFELELV